MSIMGIISIRTRFRLGTRIFIGAALLALFRAPGEIRHAPLPFRLFFDDRYIRPTSFS
jgi:hypothetical protein